MRLVGFLIEEFRSVRKQLLPAEGLIVLFGQNSAGKTSVLEAVSELLRAVSSGRADPGDHELVMAQGRVMFTLPGAEIAGSPDHMLYQGLLNGEYAGDGAWAGLSPDAARTLSGMRADEAREWLASRYADASDVGARRDREAFAYAMLGSAAVCFVTGLTSVWMRVQAGALAADVIAAARRIAACDGHDDSLWEIADELSRAPFATIADVADPEEIANAYPNVTVLDGNPHLLSAQLRTLLPEIHDRLWQPADALDPDGQPGLNRLIYDWFEVSAKGSGGGYYADTWLEQLSAAGEPMPPAPPDVYGASSDWYRVRHSILAVAAVIEAEANRIAPGFIREQGRIGIELLPVTVWGLEDNRVRVTFTGRDTKPRDLGIVGAGTARWVAAAVELACRRLAQGRQVVTSEDGAVVTDPSVVWDIMEAARGAPLTQERVRLEPVDVPGVYIIDEPEAHLHPAAIVSVRTWLEERAHEQMTVLAATHSPIMLNTNASPGSQILVQPGNGGTELRVLNGPLDDDLISAAGELGISKGELLLMSRLVLFVEGPHDAIILEEWFGRELREAGIRVFAAGGAKNFPELAETTPGRVGAEIIGAMGIKVAILSDKPTQGMSELQRIYDEAKRAGRDIIPPETLSEPDILLYLDENVCREMARHPGFPGWRAAYHDATGASKSRHGWKKRISEEYGLDFTRDGVWRLAAECKARDRIAPELKRAVQTVTAHATGAGI